MVFEQAVKEGVEQAMREYELTVGMTLEECVERQIPKQPDIEGDGYDEKGELIYDTGYCPTCRHEFEIYYDATKYCPNCGQHLDWSNVRDLDMRKEDGKNDIKN